ncbi:hypothetical protein Cri9333_0241 [Crinalium epipsammum PCC 9333]|uniref:Lipoprotein n=1 Tax=Crinalium epipsammum PCC 9333 TaxID=1173022 RepID=K9VTH3_9CYAN|nr:hypothetical protein [Crinalium epipsammum]AFZ11236.1 hypothetical protein Cri9333_0241 [Crinalium epipsammum PCC 9333]
MLNPIVNKVTINCLSLLFLSSIFTPQAEAGRYVFDQTPQTIQRYFGRPLRSSTENLGDKEYKLYTYSSARLHTVLPKLPKKAELQIAFFKNRAKIIILNSNAGSDTQSFQYGQPEAVKFYNYIFGYKPSIWQPIPLPNGGGGHEGFLESAYCLGDGVRNYFLSYMLGEDNIRLYYDPTCEQQSK